MPRRFSRKQRRHLFILDRGICAECGTRLDRRFHADHAQSYVHGGPTILTNGRALCPACNLKKGRNDAT
jgi:5-methylcytosine-specific restriction endonuclease McrA